MGAARAISIDEPPLEEGEPWPICQVSPSAEDASVPDVAHVWRDQDEVQRIQQVDMPSAYYYEKFNEDMRARYPEADRHLLEHLACLLYTSPSPRDATLSRMPSSA